MLYIGQLFFGKLGKNYMLAPPHAEGWVPPPTEILDPPMDVYRPTIGHNYWIGGRWWWWSGLTRRVGGNNVGTVHDFAQFCTICFFLQPLVHNFVCQSLPLSNVMYMYQFICKMKFLLVNWQMFYIFLEVKIDILNVFWGYLSFN